MQMLPAILSIAMAAVASQAAPEREIIDHYYVCTANIAGKSGAVTAQRFLNQTDGKLRGHDTASWVPLKYEGVEVRWWRATDLERERLAAIPGSVQFYIRAEHALPRVAIWSAHRRDYAPSDQLTIPMITGADKRLASATIPLDVILAYGAARDTLPWALTDPRPNPGGWAKTFAEGRMNVAALREAAAVAAAASLKLDTLASAPAKNCTLTPEYYDPNSEI